VRRSPGTSARGVLEQHDRLFVIGDDMRAAELRMTVEPARAARLTWS
jgi:hypothetical protein